MILNRLALLAPLAVFLSISDAKAQAYERQRVQPNGPQLCLGSRTFTYALATTAGRPTAAERAAIVAAFNAWSQAASTCSDLVFKQAEDVPNGTPPPYDGKTLVTIRKVKCGDVVPSGDACFNNFSCADKYDCWEHAASNVVQAAVTYKSTGHIVGTNIELNASNGELTTVDSPPCPQGVVQPGCVAGDVQSLVTRSIGEALGLALVNRTDSTMSRTLPWGDTQKRAIDPGTLQGLCELYPRGQPTPDCAASPPPDPETPGDEDSDGCSATTSAPLLGALVLLLGAWRRRPAPRQHSSR